MKFLLALVFVAAAAVAEPQLWNPYGSSLYSGLYNTGYSYGNLVRPSIYGGLGYRTYGYGKREAESEPEAEPESQYYGSYGYSSGLYRPYSGLYNAGYSYMRPSIYGGLGYRTYGYGKREAEAEPESQYYGGYGYNSGLYRPYSGIYNAGYSYGSIVRPSIYGGMGYRTYGYGKREAEAEPESQYYGGYGYNSGLYRPYSGIYNAGYSYGSIVRPSIYGGMGYRTYGYGKREAEAEPEAQYWNAYGSGLYRPYSGIYSTGYNYGSIVRPSIYGAGYYY